MPETATVYQTPTLVKIGSAQNLVRGVYSVGYDIDGLTLIKNQEFQDDLESLGE